MFFCSSVKLKVRQCMYVLVLVEHGVKLRIARQRAAARRTVRRCRHFWMSAPRNSARQAARRTPRRTPPAPSEKQERLWTWHSFTISFVGFEKEGGKAVAAVFSAAQWDKNVIFFTKNLHSLLEKELTYIMKHCYSNLEDCRFKPRMLQGFIHDWHWH